MTTFTAHGGVEEIGGNRLFLTDKKSSLLLDFGTSFRVQGRFFHEFLKPRPVNGLGDYLATGLAPDVPGVYRQDYRARIGRKPEDRLVDGVLLSHAHIDHAGLFPLLRPDIPLAMSTGAQLVLQMLEDTGTEEYLHYFEEFRLRKTRNDTWADVTRRQEAPSPRTVHVGAKWDAGAFTVEAYDVDHSLPGARGYVASSNGSSVAYTGDFRFHGRNRKASEGFVKRIGGIDALITEGTNLGGADEEEEFEYPAALSEEDVRDRLTDAIQKSDGFVAAGYPNRDLDRILSFWEAAKRTNRRLLLTLKQAYLVNLFHSKGLNVPALDDSNLGIYCQRKGGGFISEPKADDDLVSGDYSPWERPLVGHDNVFTAEDVRKDPRAFITYVDLYNFTELIDLNPKEGIYLYSKTEPFNEEMNLNYRLTVNWLARFNLNLVKAHASGHASEEELFHMIDAAKPKKIIPVHTHNVKAFTKAFGDRVVAPKLGQEINL